MMLEPALLRRCLRWCPASEVCVAAAASRAFAQSCAADELWRYLVYSTFRGVAAEQSPEDLESESDAGSDAEPAREVSASARDGSCVICLEKISTDGPRAARRATLSGCSHSQFHAGCVLRWLQRTANCPVCKSPAPPSMVHVARTKRGRRDDADDARPTGKWR